MAPINTEKNLHSASGECGGVKALSGGRGDSVPVKALVGLTALDGDTGQPRETVRRERSKRGFRQVIDP